MIPTVVIRGVASMRAVLAASLLLFSSTLMISGPVSAQTAKFLERFDDWSVYVNDQPGKKICFAIAEPKDKKPKNVKRGPIYFYVSHWPGDQVKNEISVKIGYPFRPGSSATVTIGKAKFKLFTKEEGAFVQDQAKEKQLVDAKRGGNLMIIQGRSKRGTLTTDRYSLKGISAALDRVAKECP